MAQVRKVLSTSFQELWLNCAETVTCLCTQVQMCHHAQWNALLPRVPSKSLGSCEPQCLIEELGASLALYNFSMASKVFICFGALRCFLHHAHLARCFCWLVNIAMWGAYGNDWKQVTTECKKHDSWLLRKHCSTLASLFSLCHLCDVSLIEKSKIEEVITPYNLLNYFPGAIISLCNGCWRLPLGVTLVMNNYLLTTAYGKWSGCDIINSSGSKGSLKTNNSTYLVQFNVPKLWYDYEVHPVL